MYCGLFNQFPFDGNLNEILCVGVFTYVSFTTQSSKDLEKLYFSHVLSMEQCLTHERFPVNSLLKE